MDVNCEGCAGCCIDWRSLTDADIDAERRGRYEPLDDTYNLVVLTRDDVRAFLDAGYGDAMTPRLFYDEGGSVEVDGRRVATLDGRPAFVVGLRKPRKPVAPFGVDPTRLPTCAFLDPETLQCRVHDSPVYPVTCAEFPGHDLALDASTECELVEETFGGDRLLDGDPPDDLSAFLLGPQAVGQKVFVYPADDVDPGADVDALVARAAADDLTDRDRARFVAAAAAGAPGTTTVDRDRYDSAVDAALAADSWIGRTIAAESDREETDPGRAAAREEARGAPPTPGWDGSGNGDADG